MHMLQRQSHRTRRRHPAYLEADIDTGFLQAKGMVLSVSDAGLFTTADLPLKSGTKVTMSFELPDLQPVHMSGEVIYQATHQEHHGLGVRFLPTNGTQDGIAAIRSFYQMA